MASDLNVFAPQMRSVTSALSQLEVDANFLAPHKHLRQPVHVVYGGAHLFRKDFIAKLGGLASTALEQVGQDGLKLKAFLEERWSDDFSAKVYASLKTKLSDFPVEDYRIDFEDGYGLRSNEEEDHHAATAAKLAAEYSLALKEQNGKPASQLGFRPKAFSASTIERSIKTVALFVKNFSDAHGINGTLGGLTVTLPKVSHESQVEALTQILVSLEKAYQYPDGFFTIELLIETAEAFFDPTGTLRLPRLIKAGRGRVSSLHFGVYDFTSCLGIGSAGQSLTHFDCDAARFLMQLTAASVPGLALSDGIINTLPVPIHRAVAGKMLSEQQTLENSEAIQHAWRLNYQQMLRSLNLGFYQGWDLHPAQIAIRHLANHVYVLKELDHAAKRLKGFLDRSSQAIRHGTVFDDRASVLGLVKFLERGLNSGVISEADLGHYGIDLRALNLL